MLVQFLFPIPFPQTFPQIKHFWITVYVSDFFLFPLFARETRASTTSEHNFSIPIPIFFYILAK